MIIKKTLGPLYKKKVLYKCQTNKIKTKLATFHEAFTGGLFVLY